MEHCFVPKHTTGEQLLNVRRDKKERAAFAAAGMEDEGDEDYQELDDEGHRINAAGLDNAA